MSLGIIKNYLTLMDNGNPSIRKDALDIMEAAVKNAIPYHKTLQLIRIENSILHLGDFEYALDQISHLYVIGVGKGAYPIAQAMEEKLGELISEGVVLIKKGDTRKLHRIEVIESGHPLPDQSGIEGAGKILKILKKAQKDDLILAAITGGSSAMLNLPAGSITLEDLRSINDLLLKSGADIGQMNTVRKHLCLMKGGQMIMYAAPAQVFTFTLDTAPVDMAWPDLSLPDCTTFQEAIEVLKKYRLWEKSPASVRGRLLDGAEHPELETPKSFPEHNSIIFSVADPRSACMEAARAAEALGYHSHILSTKMEGEAKDLGIFFAGLCNEIASYNAPFERPCALISAGETTVTIHGRCGLGGPNQETALGFVTKLAPGTEAVCISVDSDGTDGPCDIAGGITDLYTLKRARGQGVDLVKALLEHDSGSVLTQLGDAVITGHTGTNIMNLRVVLLR